MFEMWLTDTRILIIDDEPANIDFLEQLLARAGYFNVVSSSDPQQGVMLCQAFQPDLILLDWLMPVMNGYQVLQALAPYMQEQPYLPVLVLTADMSRESWQLAFSAGAKDFLVKPLDIIEVQLRIRNLLELRYLYLKLQEQGQSLQRNSQNV